MIMFAFWNTLKFKSGPPQVCLRPDPIFIIGMHRSGTSALAGALEPLGLTVGKSVMPPHAGQGNPKGFYENRELREFHDEFLKSIGSSWQHDEPVRDELFSGKMARRFQKQLLWRLVDEFGPGRPLIKDPRLCRLLPLWQPVIRQHFSSAQFILPIRHPVEVASSLHRRDQLPLGQGLKLWAIHVLEGERTTRGLRRFFSTYDQLTQSPSATVAGLAGKLGLDHANAAVVQERVDPSLRHYAGLSWPAGESHQDLILSIHQTLVSDEPGKESKLDQLRREYYGRTLAAGPACRVPGRISGVEIQRPRIPCCQTE
jgi:O-antigen biosynthesis protein